MTPIAQPGEVLTTKQAAALLGISEKTLRRLGLKTVRLGARTVRYLREDLMTYLRRRAA